MVASPEIALRYYSAAAAAVSTSALVCWNVQFPPQHRAWVQGHARAQWKMGNAYFSGLGASNAAATAAVAEMQDG